ncbi:hypothetical protein OAO39_00260 [Pirellulaceae bacterium]|nr:hypothetical protein [Pirellulaceae bacterium]
MARIYLVLASFAVSLLIANFGVGIWVGDLNGVAERVQRGARQYNVARGNGEQEAIDDARESMLSSSAELTPIKKRHGIHFLLGVLSALVCVLVNGIAMTYFIGSSKWCSEVVDTYSLDLSYVHMSRTLKRRAYPWTISGVAAIVVVVAFGAAADPATQIESSASWVAPHMIVAILGTMWLSVSFLNQAGLIGAHYEVINKIVAAVEVRRAEIGRADE